MNAARSVDRAQPIFDNRPVSEDVFFDLVEQDKIAYGQPFNVQFHVQVSAHTCLLLSLFLLLCYLGTFPIEPLARNEDP